MAGILHCGRCAAEGRSFQLVAEIKKGRYVYYHCEECKRQRRVRYVREEVLVEAFAEALDQAPIERDLLLRAMAPGALPEQGDSSPGDQTELGSADLHAELADLQARLDLAYEDRLQGRIDAAFFDRRAAAWRGRMEVLQAEMSRQEELEAELQFTRTDPSAALELRQPDDIFLETEDVVRRRQMIAAVCSNSTWDAGTLVVQWRQLGGSAAESCRGKK